MDDTIIAVQPKAIAVDSLWFDPRLLSILTYPQFTDYNLIGLSTVIVAQANIQRYGIGFATGSAVGTINFAPWPDPQDVPFLTTFGNNPSIWLELEKYGPLVCSSWSVYTTTNSILRVTELIRKG